MQGRIFKGDQVTVAHLAISPTSDVPDAATVAVYAPPLAWSQLALLLDLADTERLRAEFPTAYAGLDEIRKGLDTVLSQPIPSPREQWDQMKDDRDHLLSRLNGEAKRSNRIN